MEKISVMYIVNAFSLQMLETFPVDVRVTEVARSALPWADLVSAIGHTDTAEVLGLQPNRVNVTLNRGDKLYVAQLQGGRLPEGAKTLPDGFKFRFLRVEIL